MSVFYGWHLFSTEEAIVNMEGQYFYGRARFRRKWKGLLNFCFRGFCDKMANNLAPRFGTTSNENKTELVKNFIPQSTNNSIHFSSIVFDRKLLLSYKMNKAHLEIYKSEAAKVSEKALGSETLV